MAVNVVAVQRVLVRMMFDPAFVDAVYGDDPSARFDVPLDAESRRWVRSVDRRAFGVDRYRRSRSLHDLLLKFTLFAAHYLRGYGDVAKLQAFFASAGFHCGMQRGESLSELFARYLDGCVPADARELRDLLALEATMARARGYRCSYEGEWKLADGVAVLLDCRVDLQQYMAALQRLQEDGDPVECLLDEAFPLRPIPRSVAPRPVVARATDRVQAEVLSFTEGDLLAALSAGIRDDRLHETAFRLGIDEVEVRDHLLRWVAEGIVRAPLRREGRSLGPKDRTHG